MDSILDKNLDYYKILNLERNASISDIKKAYKKSVLSFHPDVNKDNANDEKFKEIVKAYSTLKDVDLKTEYDKMLKENENRPLKINFKFCYHEFIKKRNDLWNKFIIIFKNISGKNKVEYGGKEYELIEAPISLSEEIINMPIEDLEQRLEYSDNIYVRINASKALGLKKEKRAFTLLEKIVTTDSDIEVKKAAIWAIGNIHMKKSLNFLKLLFFSANSLLKLDILKAVYKITEGKGNLFNELFRRTLNNNNNELKIEAIDLFLKTNKKLFYRDIKGLFESASSEVRPLLERLIHENRIIDYTGENQ